MRRNIQSVNRPLTPEERDRHRQIREDVERDKPALMALGRLIRTRHERVRQAVADLKAKREALRMSLADLSTATGLAESELAELETSAHPDPTVEILMRYADAVGKELRLTVADREPAATE